MRGRASPMRVAKLEVGNELGIQVAVTKRVKSGLPTVTKRKYRRPAVRQTPKEIRRSHYGASPVEEAGHFAATWVPGLMGNRAS